MWPINFKEFPSSEEARILSLADKVIATREFFTSKGQKQKKEEEYLKNIAILFD